MDIAMDFSIAVLEFPYYSIHDAEAGSLFSKILSARFKGYGAFYKNFIPMGPEDCISNFGAVLDQKSGEVIFSFKFYPYSRAKEFKLNFSILALLQDRPELSAQIQNHIETLPHECFYLGSMSVNPKFKEFITGSSELYKNLIYGLWGKLVSEYNIKEAFALGSTEHNAFRIIENAGFKRYQEEVLELRHFNNIPTYLERFTEVSDRVQFAMRAIESYWDDRKLYRPLIIAPKRDVA